MKIKNATYLKHLALLISIAVTRQRCMVLHVHIAHSSNSREECHVIWLRSARLNATIDIDVDMKRGSPRIDY